VFAQQSLQPKLSRRCYASVSSAEQYSFQTHTELSQCQWVTNCQWEWVPQRWSRNSKTCLAVSRSETWYFKVTLCSRMEVTTTLCII